MRAIMVMYDSLNRHMLAPYGCEWVHTPNFERLAEKSVTFDTSYIGSMPCMPARRELHTGRYNFLHRSWGPIEPFDDSMPEILKENGISSHLVSDHYHYWEDGGCTYHTRYSNWRMSRGQEGDPWYGDLKDPDITKPNANRAMGQDKGNTNERQDWINRSHIKDEDDFSQTKTFAMGLEFLESNHDQDNWFLHIETFDPHEPFFSPEKYQEMYADDYEGPPVDWPSYKAVDETDSHLIPHMRKQSAALHTMCDHNLGKIIDFMDVHDMWKDTLLIVNTDHGFLLGEHGWWAKCVMPFYSEVARTPLFIWDPRYGKKGERRHSLVQTIDLPATILEFFDIKLSDDCEGSSLNGIIQSDTPVREAGIYGVFGAHVSVTDGRYVYMRAPVSAANEPLYEYTMMPTEHGAGRAFIDVERLQTSELSPPFVFTKGCPQLKIPGKAKFDAHSFGHMLFDTANNEEQLIEDADIEKRMINLMINLMKANNAPVEQFERLGLNS